MQNNEEWGYDPSKITDLVVTLLHSCEFMIKNDLLQPCSDYTEKDINKDGFSENITDWIPNIFNF